mgnify:CR=1 FL=1
MLRTNRPEQWLILPVILLFAACAHVPPKVALESRGMVVAAHPIAAEFGYEILQSGGNAIDAAVATAMVLGVVEPHASGLGGGGGMLIYLADQDSLTYINYYPRAAHEIPKEFRYCRDGYTAKAVLVPGTVAGLSMALQKYGTMSWQEILERSIEKVKNGFVIDEHFNKVILDSYEILSGHEQTADIFLNEMLPFELGDTLVNTDILRTFRYLADNGPEFFYEGDLADSIETIMIREGGQIRKSDLQSYQAIELSPVSTDYRAYHIVSSPPPQSGLTTLEILNILELQDIRAMGDFKYHDSTFHFMAEAMKLGYADRDQYLGDPQFVDVPVDILIDDAYAKSRYAEMDHGKAIWGEGENTPAGSIRESLSDESDDPDGSTTHLSVIDRAGNAVSLTQTLSRYWGSGISVGGFLLNDGMTSFSISTKANIIEPDKQPRSTISPSFIFKNDELYVIVGTPGGGRIPATMVEIITNLLDFDQNAVEANRAPRFYSRDNSRTIAVERRFDQSLLDALEKRGHKIEVFGEMDNYFGGVHLIMIDQKTGELFGSADPRRSGVVAGGQ